MDRKSTIWIAVLVIAALLGFGYVLFRSATVMEEPLNVAPAPEGMVIETIITAKHAYIDGKHQLSGEITLPTPCHLLEHTVTILPDESRATIAFVRTFAGGQCPGGKVPGPFFVEFPGKPDTAITATLDGREVRLSLIEAGPEENLEETEVYIKG